MLNLHTQTHTHIHTKTQIQTQAHLYMFMYIYIQIYIYIYFGWKVRNNIGLYRDDGLDCFGYTSGPQADTIKKDFIKIFKEDYYDLIITCDTNLKAVNFLDVTLNLTTGKCQPYNKPDNNPLYINILSNHPPNIIKNLPGNISKRINNLSADETTFNKSKDLYNNALAESGFEHKIRFQKQQNTSVITNDTKNRKRKITWFNPPFSLNVLTKNSSAYWVNISQKRISFINCSTVIMPRLVIVLYVTLKVWSTVIIKIY